MALGALALGCSEAAVRDVQMDPWVGSGKTRILVDSIHQLEAPPNAVWDETEFRYAHSQSANRLLMNLLPHDFRFRLAHDGALSLDLLRAHDILYFNVPTAITTGSSKTERELPRLRGPEVEALTTWLEEGGGILMVGEHNNAYDNVEVLRPFLEQFGVEIAIAYAVETGRGRYAMDYGGYILTIREFARHWITGGVRMASWSGGAPFTKETKGGVAFLSKTGFIDYGDYVTKKPSKGSNHRVDEGEYQGPGIPLVVALEVGKGRLVVVGDHNMLGNQWLGVGDNRRFGMNIMQWLAHRDDEPRFADAPPVGVRVGFEQERSGWTIGRRDVYGYYGLFYNITRRPDVFAMGLMDLADEAEVYGFLDPQKAYPEEELAKVDRALDAGKKLFLLVDLESPGAGSAQIVARYAPDVAFVGGDGRRVTGRELPNAGSGPLFARRSGAYGRLVAPALGAGPEDRIAALHHDPSNLKGSPKRDVQPKDYAKGVPYLLDLRVEGGEPLAEAALEGGGTATILQRVRARNGELVLMAQGKIFSGLTMHCVREEPIDANKPAYDLLMLFTRWLASGPAPTQAAAAAPDAPDAGTDGTR